jgi:glycosyltransferase involved in cell wall biosynthesis
MRIAFDISQTGGAKAGCGFFSYSLIEGLTKYDNLNQYALLPTFGDFFWDPNWESALFQTELASFTKVPGANSFEESKLFWSSSGAAIESMLSTPDILHSNNFFCPSRLKSTRLVYTLYDLSFIENPDWTTEANRVGCFQGVFNASLFADFIVSISEYSKNHFLKIFPFFPEHRIRVVYPASKLALKENVARPVELAQVINAQKFWLVVGTIEPRKNLIRLLEAYKIYFKKVKKPMPLVIVGGLGWMMEHFNETIKNLNIKEHVIVTGYLREESLQWLYENCFALLYPSLFEGFGFPVVEALSKGKPVITSNTTSLPEVAGDAAILIDPLSPWDIAEGMQSLENPQVYTSIEKRTLPQAQKFSWEKASQEIMQCYADVMKLPKRN